MKNSVELFFLMFDNFFVTKLRCCHTIFSTKGQNPQDTSPFNNTFCFTLNECGFIRFRCPFSCVPDAFLSLPLLSLL